jgi:pentatricopeptide repeat protein
MSSSSTLPKTLLYNAMLRGYLSLGLPLQAAALFRDIAGWFPFLGGLSDWRSS